MTTRGSKQYVVYSHTPGRKPEWTRSFLCRSDTEAIAKLDVGGFMPWHGGTTLTLFRTNEFQTITVLRRVCHDYLQE